MKRHDATELVGRTVAGKYIVQAVIGQGGTGAVYQALQLPLNRTVALKVLHRELADDQQFIRRFKREALAASRLDHPNSVRVLDFGQDQDVGLYLAMEHVKGRTLYQLLHEDAPLSYARIVEILAQVLACLGVAHEMGVIHRDLKPENIIVVPGRSDDGEAILIAKVCDFGIATLVTPARGDGAGPSEMAVTVAGLVVGTPAYMSPEQLRAEPADQRSDVYSMGVILYEMLAGRLPFEDDNFVSLAVKQVLAVPVSPSVAAGRPVNARLEAACLKAMSKAPSDRFATAWVMRAALREAIEGGAAAEPAIARGRATWRTAGITAATVVGALLGGYLLLRWSSKEDASPRRGTVAAPAAGLTIVAPAPVPPAPVPGAPRPRVIAAKATGATSAAAGAGERADDPPRAQPEGLVGARANSDRKAPQPGGGVAVSRSPSGGPSEEPAREPPKEPPQGSPKEEAVTLVVRATVPAAAPAVASGPSSGPPSGPYSPALPIAVPRPGAGSLPSSPASADSPASSAKSPAPPAPAAVNLAHAAVTVTAVTTTSAIPGALIRAAIRRVPFLRCYQDALRSRGAPVEGIAKLRLQIDITGYVTSATLDDAQFLPSMKGCIEQSARAVRVRDVDTGEATAVVTLNFVAPS